MLETPPIPISIGLDIIDISRFEPFNDHLRRSADHRLAKIFSKKEIAYCFKFKEPAAHLAGIFAAKEAASKALGAKRFPFIGIEVRHARDGAPQIWSNSRKLPVKVSISHTDTVAAAVALAYNKNNEKMPRTGSR